MNGNKTQNWKSLAAVAIRGTRERERERETWKKRGGPDDGLQSEIHPNEEEIYKTISNKKSRVPTVWEKANKTHTLFISGFRVRGVCTFTRNFLGGKKGSDRFHISSRKKVWIFGSSLTAAICKIIWKWVTRRHGTLNTRRNHNILKGDPECGGYNKGAK